MRCCCPGNDIDWTQRGGLCYCNWPWCDPSPDAIKSLKIAENSAFSLTVEIEHNPALMPLFALCVLCVVPPLPFCIACGPEMNQTAWTFKQEESGLTMTRRQKRAYAEQQTLESSCVTMTSVQVIEDYDSQRDTTVTKKRLAISTRDHGVLYSPWKEDSTSHVDNVSRRINALIPTEHRDESLLANAEVMQRGGMQSVQAVPVGYEAKVPTSPSQEAHSPYHDIPMSKLVEAIKRELGISDLASSKLTFAEIIEQACAQLGVVSSGVLKQDAIEVIRQLEVRPEQLL
eukprot:gene33463-40485_t